jgi:hypothetical protein
VAENSSIPQWPGDQARDVLRLHPARISKTAKRASELLEWTRAGACTGGPDSYFSREGPLGRGAEWALFPAPWSSPCCP